MSDKDALEPRNVTFSQAHGYEELPQPLKLEELSEEARTLLWSSLYHYVSKESEYHVIGRWRNILQTLHLHFHGLPLDEFDSKFRHFINLYKSFIMYEKFNRVFDLLQTIMRHPSCSHEFTKSVAMVFEKCLLAYVVDVTSPPTIYPASVKEEGLSILRATDELSRAGLTGAANHLRKASEYIIQRDYPSAVRESIHAVESTARRIDPNAKDLKSALLKLKQEEALHPALRQGFSNLYGYTSDEQGIRHALIDNPQANVGQDEAVFMLGACASFSSYLARKHHTPAS